MIKKTSYLLFVLVTTVGCFRGLPSSDPPVHPNLNMDTQYKYKPYRSSAFYENKSSMRLPVEGTIARGSLNEDILFYQGLHEDGEYVKKSPLPLTRVVLARGQDRYKIHCATCHGEAGDGKSLLTDYGIIPTSYHNERLRNIEDGYIFDVISNGIRTMPRYKHAISVEDRWAIVHYVRALQRSQYAPESDVPKNKKEQLINKD